jgi:hypothetical protein
MTDSSNTNLNEPISDKGHLLTSLPDPKDLDGLRQRIVDIGNWAKEYRDRGDDFIDSHDETGARAAYEKALDLEKWSINIAKRYNDFRLMFDADGGPLPSGRNSNYPLEGGEQRLASIYCDRLGRIGGLLRRLGKLSEAREYYAIGAKIERDGGNFGVSNSYSTLNNLLLDIELGEKRATPGTGTPKPDLAAEIKKIIAFVRQQIDGPRANDAWAKVDLATALVLSRDDNETRQEAEDYFRSYAKAARPRDIGTTLRILGLVEEQLKQMEDPAGSWTAWAIRTLEREAREAGKLRLA